MAAPPVNVLAEGKVRRVSSPSISTFVAFLGCALGAAALVVALSADEPAPAPAPAPARVATTSGPVPLARRAERADRADAAERAATATTAKRAASARRLTGQPGRMLAASARRSRAVVAPAPARLEPGDDAVVLDRGGLRLMARCLNGRSGAPDLRVTASSRADGALLEIAGTPVRRLGPERAPVVLRLTGSRPVWLGARAFTLASPRGRAVHGVLSLGVNHLGAACFFSAAALA